MSIYIPLLVIALASWTPRPSDASMVRGDVFYIQVDGSTVSGWLPTPCHDLRIDETGDALDVYSVTAPGMYCCQTLTYFEVDIMPPSLPRP